MNRLARYAMLLYPARWRRRYGDEVEALIDDAGADARMIADLVRGALRMQFSTWSFPRLAAVLGLLGMLIGLAFSFLTPVKYVAHAELQLTGAGSGVRTTDMLSTTVSSRTSLGIIITDRKIDLYREERKTSPLDDVIEQMRRDLVVRPDGPNAFAIQFAYRDKAKARAAVQAMAERAANQLRNSAAASGNPNAIEVIDPATLPVAPLRPDLLPMSAGGLAIGLLLAALWQLKSRRFRYLSLGSAGALAGIAIAYLIPSIFGIFPDDFPLLRYESHATMYSERGDAVPGLVMEAGSRSAMGVVIADRHLRLYASLLTNHTVEDIADRLRRNLVIKSRSDGASGRFIDISFTYFDRVKGQQTLNAIMSGIVEADRSTGSPANAAPLRQTQWGRIVPGSEDRVTVDTVSPNRAAPMIPGLLVGLALAMIIAAVRRRWVPAQDGEMVVLRHSAALKFNSARFRKLAIWLVAAGAAGGTLVAILAPARYASDTLVSFDNLSPNRVATLIDDAGDGRRDLSWRQVESEGIKLNTFRIQFVANDPLRARSVVQDVLGDIDRGVTNLHGGASVQMNVIDPPVLPLNSDGIGWWAVAIGTLFGLVLAFLVSLIGGTDGWFVANGPDAIAGASIH